jgi:hypothetical protein
LRSKQNKFSFDYQPEKIMTISELKRTVNFVKQTVIVPEIPSRFQQLIQILQRNAQQTGQAAQPITDQKAALIAAVTHEGGSLFNAGTARKEDVTPSPLAEGWQPVSLTVDESAMHLREGFFWNQEETFNITDLPEIGSV